MVRERGTDLMFVGSEAMEAAIKLCRQYWVEKGESHRKYIIARFPSYHGNTLGALAVRKKCLALLHFQNTP
jgi:adenosylmethionine-8-amino-7-oxononanoate aminotransferase